MSDLPQPPPTHREFTEQFPSLATAWDQVRDAERVGPIDERTRRIVKLAVAMGTTREGAVHSAVRKALAAGVSEDEIYQTIALAASNLGFPATVTIFAWVRDELRKQG